MNILAKREVAKDQSDLAKVDSLEPANKYQFGEEGTNSSLGILAEIQNIEAESSEKKKHQFNSLDDIKLEYPRLPNASKDSLIEFQQMKPFAPVPPSKNDSKLNDLKTNKTQPSKAEPEVVPEIEYHRNVFNPSVLKRDLDCKSREELKQLAEMYSFKRTTKPKAIKYVLQQLEGANLKDKYLGFMNFGYIRQLLHIHKDRDEVVQIIKIEAVTIK